MIPSHTQHALHVAVVGGGIAGASVASTLARATIGASGIHVDVFDQGRSGVGGRTSHRITTTTQEQLLQWDHGCQFFRADTPRFRAVVEDWIQQGMAAEWKGDFRTDAPDADFFGLPSQPPFYVGVGGIRTIPDQLLKRAGPNVTVYSGHRVGTMKKRQNDNDDKWDLYGTTGDVAYHDTKETLVEQSRLTNGNALLGNAAGYDAVVLTDVSSSFDSWHRASAGVPPDFAARVRAAGGARVPLFTCMIALQTPILPASLSAVACSNNERLWFAARSQSKAGLEHLECDCWTLVSTPEYAIQKIQETPMQDPTTGAFLPQSPEYLTTVPGPELEEAFRDLLVSGVLGTDVPREDLPKTLFLGAQRWGSAMPAHRKGSSESEQHLKRQVVQLSGVTYDSGRGSLAPTTKVLTSDDDNTQHNFIADEDQMIFQAGDMVSVYTPGFEGAALSGMDLGEYLVTLLVNKRK